MSGRWGASEAPDVLLSRAHLVLVVLASEGFVLERLAPVDCLGATESLCLGPEWRDRLLGRGRDLLDQQNPPGDAAPCWPGGQLASPGSGLGLIHNHSSG